MLNQTTLVIRDDGFGPFFKQSGRQDFDFTLLFEETILSILPSTIFLLACPIRLVQLWHEPRKVAQSQLRNIKIVLLAIFTTLQIANLVVWCLDPEIQTRASLTAASLSVVSTLALCAVSYLEHTRCVGPSTIINAYLLFTSLTDAAKVRTLWLRGESTAIAALGSALLAVKLVVLMVEAKEKRNFLLSPYSEYPPEATSSLYSKSLFWWLNPLFLLGYRNIIRDADVFPTDNDLASDTLHQKIQARWLLRSTPCRRYELMLTVAQCLVRPLLAGIFPRICQSFFRFMQPLLIKRVTTLVGQPESQATTNQGWGLTAAYGLVFFGIAVSAARYHHRAFRFVTMVRGALVATIYNKTMDLSITALDESAAVTLMSTDVQRICDSLALVHELWACPIDIGIAVWLLYREIGLATIGPLVLAILAIAGTFLISSRTSVAQKEWLAGIQTRVDVTAKALQNMKGVKMLGLNNIISDIIRKLRLKEISQSLKARKLFTANLVFCMNTGDAFAPGIAFTIFVITAHYNGQTLNVGSAYTALSLIGLLCEPIAVFAMAVPPIMVAVGCCDRIQRYLLSASRHDHRLLMPTSHEMVSRVSQPTSQGDSYRASSGIELREVIRSKPSVASPGVNHPVLNVVNLTLAWNENDSPVINDVSFEISSGVTMLVGSVGCGKSSLIKGLLGEIPSSKGYIYTDSLQIAYVGQDPWIQHGTLRDNIVGMSSFEHKFYSTVVHACALDQDFQSLPQGDSTPVGSAGASLSGGQKLRVALARAVYSRRHILMLDDVFSGLDAASEDRIFSRLLGKNGLVKEMDTTVLLATHAAHRLSYADKVIVLNPDGSITEQGTFSELMNKQTYVSQLAARHTTEVVEKTKEIVELTKNPALNSVAQANAAEDLTRSVGDVSVYKYYFKATGYRQIIVFLSLALTFAFFHLFPNVWIQFWTSAVAARGNSVNALYLGIFLTLEAMSWLGLAGVCYHTFLIMIPISARELHQRLLDAMSNAPLSFFTSTDIGQVINRFSQDMSVLDYELPGAFFQCTISTFIAIIQAILICSSAGYFAAAMPFVIGLMYLIQKFYLRTSRQIRLMDLEAKAPLYSNFIESLNGLATIRAFGWSEDFEIRNRTLLDNSQRPFYMLFCIQRWLNLVLDLTVMGLAVFLMSLIVILRTKLNAGLVGLALLSIMSFNLSLTQIIRNYTTLETSLGAIARIRAFVRDTTSEHLPAETEPVPEAWPVNGSISFSNVSASYKIDGPQVLNSINLNISSGQKVGLVGRSGSGKSSFITTLFHMLEITDGTITIDNIDLAIIPRETLRQRLNVIPQDPLFIAGTIRLNLDPFTLSESETDLVTVLKTVGLWSIVETAGGLDIAMDPENLLSHGQRQLFCLARAIVNKSHSSILVLDEATASVDLQTDETMQRIIREEFGKCTIIAVAHRLGTIADFDRVVVLDRGRIVEDGAPQKLLEDRASWFRKLWDS